MASPINPDQIDSMPVVANLADFDRRSGNVLERAIFNHRPWIIAFCILTSLVLAVFGTRLVVNASFEKLIPQSHPYIKNYLANKDEIRGLGNSIRVVVENTGGGTIFEKDYLEVLRDVNDTLVLTPGVFRPFVKSIWMPGVRWTEVTEEGFRGGPVMPGTYNGSAESIEELRLNVARAGLVGTLVANDQKSAMIVAPMLERYADTGQRIDYGSLGRLLEDNIRSKELVKRIESKQRGNVKIHIIGFGKLVGDLIAGLVQVMLYFAIAALIAAAIIYSYTRCVRSTALVVACSLVAVVWQLGLVNLLGFELDPYSVLVPFLVFAIGVSHGAQKMNGIMQDVARGTHKYVAARYTFRRLFLAGLTALMADVVGFAVLRLIDIPVIKELGATASIGVGVLVFTNLVMLPVLLSYFGVSLSAAKRSLQAEQSDGKGVAAIWNFLDRFTERKWATIAVSVATVLGICGYVVSLNLQIGDLDSGAPELRPDSRYNRDNAYITSHYGLSSDQFAVIVKTPPGGCEKYETQVEVDRLGWALRQVAGVQTTQSMADAVPRVTSGFFEGSPKWITISHNQSLVNTAIFRVQDNSPDLLNPDCSVIPVIAYLSDHKAATLSRVLTAVEGFAAEHNNEHIQFLPVAGSAGIDAVTNIVVQKANRTMMFYVYLAVILLCYITFRNVRAVIVAVLPLVLTSILCEALMVALGIGMKVASLPVIALGVGIGVDYALYLMSIQLGYMRSGLSLTEAYRKAVQFTGKVVALVGATLAAGVVTWAWSPIKFQADMGILLTFMFLWNMVGALILIPALSHFLLQKRPAQKV